ncbi:MHYT domain-containing protein [Streptomyces sp. Tue6028]
MQVRVDVMTVVLSIIVAIAAPRLAVSLADRKRFSSFRVAGCLG